MRYSNNEDFRSEETSIYYDAYTASENIQGRSRIEQWRRIGILCRMLQKDFLDITDENVASFIHRMEERIRKGELALETLRTRLYTYDNFASYLVRTGVMEKNPFGQVYKPTVDDRPCTESIPSTVDCNAIMAVAADEGMDMYLIFAMALRMGLFSTDICDIKTKHILFLEDGGVAIYFFNPESKNEKRYVRVPEDMEQMLKLFINTVTTEYLFVNSHRKKLNPPALNKRVRSIMERAGVPGISLRDLRNRAIYQMINDGADPAEVAKYTNISMQRMRVFKDSPLIDSEMLCCCPADMSHLKVVNV